MTYCFKCRKEMKCLKNGFRFSTPYETYITDLFYCEECLGLSTNRCTEAIFSNHTHMDELFGFSEDFLEHVRTWYPNIYDRFVEMYDR